MNTNNYALYIPLMLRSIRERLQTLHLLCSSMVGKTVIRLMYQSSQVLSLIST